MNRERIVKTPETDPNHHTVGRKFKAWDGKTYFCDSWVENMGYWMSWVDATDEDKADPNSRWRKNVSERAIGRTFHEIHDYKATF